MRPCFTSLANQSHAHLLLLLDWDLLVAEEGQENVVEDLDGVDVQQPLRGRDEGEVHRVRRNPHRPAANELCSETRKGGVSQSVSQSVRQSGRQSGRQAGRQTVRQ